MCFILKGNVGSGKSVFAQNLADQLGMRYFPELNLDTAYVTEEGFDYRSFNEHLPLQARFPDLPDVFEYRHPTQAAALQHILYRMRFMNYVNALTHLYQTGQGCVVERSPWSDSVFADHLKNENFYSSSFGNFYWMMRSQTISFLQRPHLVIYIDVDADKCLETIQKRNTVTRFYFDLFFVCQLDWPSNHQLIVRIWLLSFCAQNFEVKHVNKRFLQGIETLYKEKMLPRIEKHAELMILQMNQSINEKNVEDNVLLAISDIENLDFEQYFKTERDTEKMDDWKYLCSEGAWNQMRRYYSNERDDLLSRFYLPDYDVKELQVPPELMVLRDHIMNIYVSLKQYLL